MAGHALLEDLFALGRVLGVGTAARNSHGRRNNRQNSRFGHHISLPEYAVAGNMPVKILGQL
jgi:hypothetical protein